MLARLSFHKFIACKCNWFHGKPFSEGEFLKRLSKIKILLHPKTQEKMESSNWLKMVKNNKKNIKFSPWISLFWQNYWCNQIWSFSCWAGNNCYNITTTPKGRDVCRDVQNSLAEKEIDMNKITLIRTDATSSMIYQFISYTQYNIRWLTNGNVRFVDYLGEISLR